MLTSQPAAIAYLVAANALALWAIWRGPIALVVRWCRRRRDPRTLH